MKITIKELKEIIRGTILKEMSQASRHVLVSSLPNSIQSALSAVGYGRKDIEMEPATQYSMQGAGGDGSKSFSCLIDLETGARKIEYGSWGGANMFNDHNEVDLNDTLYPLPFNGAVIKGSSGGGRPVYAHILINPENLEKLLPSGGQAPELSEKEKYAIKIIKSYKAGSRKDGFNREDLGPYSPENPIIQKLLSLGLIQISKVGIQITLDGKNLADSLENIYV